MFSWDGGGGGGEMAWPTIYIVNFQCVVQFRPCCQVCRLGPLDLTH